MAVTGGGGGGGGGGCVVGVVAGTGAGAGAGAATGAEGATADPVGAAVGGAVADEGVAGVAAAGAGVWLLAWDAEALTTCADEPVAPVLVEAAPGVADPVAGGWAASVVPLWSALICCSVDTMDECNCATLARSRAISAATAADDIVLAVWWGAVLTA